jgi:3-hydroxybutyryl-CoA dehydratase
MARHRLIEDMEVGQRFTWRRSITHEDILATIRLTGDHGGYHVDEAFARRAGFRTLIAPGLLQGSLATKLGGDLNFLAREMNYQFLKPVYAGDELEVAFEVVSVEREKNRLTFEGAVTNQAGEQVVTFRATGYMPRPDWGIPIKPGRP